MVKIIKDGVVYYIRDEVAQGASIDLDRLYSLLSLADMAIDTTTFALLKYRYDVINNMQTVKFDDRVYYLESDTVEDCCVDLRNPRDVATHADIIIDKETLDVLKSRDTQILSEVV